MGAKRQLEKGVLQHNVSLAPLTTWKIGGAAERFYWPVDLADLQQFLSQLVPDEPLTWLGLGSNVLIADEGLAGTVILTQGVLNGLEQVGDTIVRAEAGVSCAQLARFAARHDLVGGEFFAGIPGTVGGALRMNAGAFGGETWERVEQVAVLTHTGEYIDKPADAFKPSYRHIDGLGSNEWFAQGWFHFEPGDGKASLAAIKALLAKRAETQPTGEACCGSVFRNPPGDYAARLIEQAGLKGYRVGGAEVSRKHANFIINTGDAIAADVVALIVEIEQVIKTQYGISLIREVEMVGFTQRP